MLRLKAPVPVSPPACLGLSSALSCEDHRPCLTLHAWKRTWSEGDGIACGPALILHTTRGSSRMRPVADNPTVLLLSHSAVPQSGSQFPSRDHSSERFPCFQCRPKLTLALSYCSELNFRLSLLHSTCCFPLPPIKGSKNPQCFSPMWMYLTSNPKLPNPQPLREVTEGLLCMLAQGEAVRFSISSPALLLSP